MNSTQLIEKAQKRYKELKHKQFDRNSFLNGYFEGYAGSVISKQVSVEKDWTEDFEHENGMYQNRCRTCNGLFIGYKRRLTCKECATKQVSVEPEVSAENSEDERFLRIFDKLLGDCTKGKLFSGEYYWLTSEKRIYKIAKKYLSRVELRKLEEKYASRFSH